jgi:hypothetical protein
MDFVEVPLRGREALARDLFERRVIGDLDLRPAFSPPVDYVEIVIGKPQPCNSRRGDKDEACADAEAYTSAMRRITKSRPIDPVFRPDGVVLAISAGKDGNCGWSTPGSDAAKVVLLGEVLKLLWRGPTPPLRVT